MLQKVTFSFQAIVSDPLKLQASQGEGLALKVLGNSGKGREKGGAQTTGKSPRESLIYSWGPGAGGSRMVTALNLCGPGVDFKPRVGEAGKQCD